MWDCSLKTRSSKNANLLDYSGTMSGATWESLFCMYTCNIRYSLMAEPTQSVAKKSCEKAKAPHRCRALLKLECLLQAPARTP